MSSPSRHVAEQPDLLAADAEWRVTLTEVVGKLNANLAGIKDVMRDLIGNEVDAQMLFDGSNEMVKILEKLRLRHEAVLVSLESQRDEWYNAVRERDGELGELDSRLRDRKVEIRRSEDSAQKTKEQCGQVERELDTLTKQVSAQIAAKEKADADLASLRRSCEFEEARLNQLNSDLTKREEALTRKEREQAEREASIRARQEECKQRLNTIQAREEAVSKSESSVQQEKKKNDTASQNIQSALSILKDLANATGSDLNDVPTLDNIRDLAASIQARHHTLQASLAEKDQTLVDQQSQLRGVEGNLGTTTQELDRVRESYQAETTRLRNSRKALHTQMSRALVTRTTEFEQLDARYADLQANHDTLARQLEEANEGRQRDQEQILTLQSTTIPRLLSTERELRSIEKDLQSKVRRLEEESRLIKAGRTASDAEVNKLRSTTIRNLEATEKDLQSKVNELEQENERLKADCTISDAEVDNLRSTTIKELEATKIRLQTNEMWLEGAIKRLKADCAARDAELAGLRSTTIPRLEATEKDLQSKVNELEQENERLKADCTASDGKLAEFRAREQTLNATVQQLGAGLSKAEEANKSSKTSYDKELADFTRKVNAETEARQRSLQQLDAAANSISALQREKHELASQLSDFEISLVERSSECRALKEAAQETTTKITDLESKCNENIAIISRLEDEAKLAASSAEDKITGLQSQCNEKIAIISRLEDEAKLAASSTGDKIAELEADVENRDSDIQTLGHSHRSLDAELERRLSQVQELTDRQRHLESVIKEKDSGIQTLDQRRRSLEVDKETLTTDIAGLRDGQRQDGQELRTKQEEITRLTEALSLQQAANQELQRRNAQLRSEASPATRSSQKRRHDQVNADEEDRSTARQNGGAGNASNSSVRATVTGTVQGNPLASSSTSGLGDQRTTTSGDQLEEPPVLRHGTRWRIVDVLDERSTAPSMPQAILGELRSRIRIWDRQRPDWRAGSTDRLSKCAERFAYRHGTKWVNGDSHRACLNCSSRGLICVAVSNQCVEILPVNGSSSSGPSDIRYWVES